MISILEDFCKSLTINWCQACMATLDIEWAWSFLFAFLSIFSSTHCNKYVHIWKLCQAYHFQSSGHKNHIIFPQAYFVPI